MPLDAAALSSISTALDDLTLRITALADSYQASPREDVAADLYEVERSLKTGARRLAAVLRRLGDHGRS
jgi:Mg2+ and Co2+ transporter CorA